MSENTLFHRAIELCLAIYRITDKFPRGEILKQKLRTKSIDIIETLVYNGIIPANSSRLFNTRKVPLSAEPQDKFQALEREIRVLFAYFSVAEKQGWVDQGNFQALREAYRDFYRTVINPSGSDPDGLGVRPRAGLNTGINPGIHTGIKRPESAGTQRQPRLSARQEKIVGFLGAKEGGQAISDIAGKIETSNKTAERELKKLMGMGRARKQGNTRSARFLVAG